MIKLNNNQYVEIFRKLPAEIKDVITSPETTERLWTIAKQHNLQIDKTGVIIDLTFDVVMGIVAARDFVKEIADNVGISMLEAGAIGRDVDEIVFKPIKNSMVKTFGDGAPYKPSSTLVQFYEEDDDHPALNKENILKEIENPAEPVVKKEIVAQPIIEEPKIAPPKTPHTELISRPEEISPTTEPKPQVESKDTAPQTSTDSPHVDFLNKIASIRLSQSIVMPKQTEELSAIVEKRVEGPKTVTIHPEEISPTVIPKQVMNEPAVTKSEVSVAQITQTQPAVGSSKPIEVKVPATTTTEVNTPKPVAQVTGSLDVKAPQTAESKTTEQQLEVKPKAYTVDPYREQI